MCGKRKIQQEKQKKENKKETEGKYDTQRTKKTKKKNMTNTKLTCTAIERKQNFTSYDKML
jgi:hypothetical protein